MQSFFYIRMTVLSDYMNVRSCYAMDGSIKRLHGCKKAVMPWMTVLSDYMDVKEL